MDFEARRVCATPCAPSPAYRTSCPWRLRASCPRPLVPDAVYHLDRWFQTRSTAYIPVGVSPHTGHPVHGGCGPPALSPHTGHPVHGGCGPPALSPHTGLPVHNFLSINDDIPRRHSSESWNPGGERRGSESMAGFAGYPRSVVMPVVIPACRQAGMDDTNHWIPAFAGMTNWSDSGVRRAATGVLPSTARSRRGLPPTSL